MADLCRALGVVPRGANYANLRLYARDQLIDISRLESARRPRFDASDEDLRRAIAATRSMAGTLRYLGLPVTNAGRRFVRHAVDRLGVCTEHWQRSSRAELMSTRRRRPIEAYLVDGRTVVSSSFLRERLLDEGILAARCDVCTLTKWNGEPIPLELDHIDGDRRDNRLTNLRLVCPNCHAQTPTYRGRNIGRYGE